MVANQRKFNWGEFLLGILFILTSLMVFKNPLSSLLAIVFLFAISAILEGIFQIGLRRRLARFTGQKATWLLVLGIIDVILGIFLLFNTTAGIIALPYVFAAWFIIDSLGELLMAGAVKEMSTGYYWFKIIINILGVVLGFMLLFNAAASALTISFLVGFYFMISGIDFLIAAF
ncbi:MULTISPECIES: HdeD family acid-resistance protein [Enterococcus]|uniref:DUF308 domain-containing protein n=1 Tax=Enterococcus alishanensis TaxID=1303817 RepID=A0ABS6TCT3_9ENTE|nr:DUF308 domain-containing protein [Enterococcus alishanensis]MBV7390705.1 DUF308 domain-containing protein [Enterococcus alishanensis]